MVNAGSEPNPEVSLRVSLLIYILCYDDASEAHARQHFAQYPWARIMRLPTGVPAAKIMEGQAFEALLTRQDEWEHVDFVGTLSWRAHEKIRVDLVEASVKQLRAHDVIAFMPLLAQYDYWILQTISSHPRFLEIWTPLLVHMGYSIADTVSVDMPVFFCNYWVATPDRMKSFLRFYTRALQCLDALPEIQGALWSDSQYRGSMMSADALTAVFGRPYMTYHPFLCERLPCFFFWKHRASIACMPIARTAFWQGYFRGRYTLLKKSESDIDKMCLDPPRSKPVMGDRS